MEDSKAHHYASQQGQKSKHFYPLHPGIGVTKNTTVKHWMEQLFYSEKRYTKISPKSAGWSPAANGATNTPDPQAQWAADAKQMACAHPSCAAAEGPPMESEILNAGDVSKGY